MRFHLPTPSSSGKGMFKQILGEKIDILESKPPKYVSEYMR